MFRTTHTGTTITRKSLKRISSGAVGPSVS